MGKIAIGIVGVGNCAGSRLQGIEFYRAADEKGAGGQVGLMHDDVCGYRRSDIEVVCAFDVDQRKVGQPLDVAALALPNNPRALYPKLPPSGVTVEMGPVLDGVAEHMHEYPPEEAFVVAERRPADVGEVLRRSGAEMVVNYLPVGSQAATEHYARACLEAGVSFINCIPVFIASDPQWAAEFERRRIPLIGDDVKSQLGATILHRMLARLFVDRGVALDRTYQLNTGGNTDFLNMLNRTRTNLKRRSKRSEEHTSELQSQSNLVCRLLLEKKKAVEPYYRPKKSVIIAIRLHFICMQARLATLTAVFLLSAFAHIRTVPDDPAVFCFTVKAP